jgi:hypothetical protein
MKLIVAIVCLVAAFGCKPTDGCTVASTRCNGNVAQICGSDQRWRSVMDCTELSGGDFCCCYDNETPSGHTCLPTSECQEVRDAE